MGLLADKHGRALVMALSMAGMTLSFGFSVLVCSYPDFFGDSLRWTWAGSLFNFLGGGMTVFSAMVFSMLSDVSGDGERYISFYDSLLEKVCLTWGIQIYGVLVPHGWDACWGDNCAVSSLPVLTAIDGRDLLIYHTL